MIADRFFASQLYSCIFARTSIAKKLKDVAVTQVKNGFDELTGNKGALITRFVLEDTSFCFLNNHLAAGEEELEHRRKDIINIMDSDLLKPGSLGTRRAYSARGDGSHVSDHSVQFFAGELASLISQLATDISPLDRRPQLPCDPAEEGRSRSDTAEQDRRADPLRRVGQRAPLQPLLPPSLFLRAASDFSADLVSHFSPSRAGPKLIFGPPSRSKYDTGTTTYDTSQKHRVPSWCDRILYRSDQDTIKPLDYRRFEATISDHRPVAGFFTVSVRKISLTLREKEYRDVLRGWALEEQRLLEDCRDRFEADDDY